MDNQTSMVPDTDIVITPAMIEAGLSALFAFDSRFETECDCVVDVFRAMWRAMEVHERAEDRPTVRREDGPQS
jgi:hypothetical protein